MTIRDAVKKGRLPDVGLDFIVNVCKSLNIPAKNIDYDLSVDQLRRLQFSPQIHRLSVSEEVKNAHSALASKYDKLINKYKNLSYYMGQSGYLDDSKKEIDEILGELLKAKDGYDNVIRNVFIAKKDLGFDSSVLNPIDSVKMGVEGFMMDRAGSKLNNQYEKLDELSSRKYRSKFKRRINNKRINRVYAKIGKLQRKQGKMQAVQRKIVNKGSEKYARKKMREMEEFYADLKRYSVYGDLKASLKQSKENYEFDINQTKAELAALEGKTGLKNGARKIAKNAELALMAANLRKFRIQEKAVEHLRNKPGRCKLSQQYYRTIAKALSA